MAAMTLIVTTAIPITSHILESLEILLDMGVAFTGMPVLNDSLAVLDVGDGCAIKLEVVGCSCDEYDRKVVTAGTSEICPRIPRVAPGLSLEK